ncbi:MAG TPA: DegV family protein [Epulopiscium sp.]|nr:DegV family protein [Candidatus Epulonipiscium sp.]
MNNDKVAILVDSCVDVPRSLVEQYNMYVIPLRIIYKDREYTDGVDITAEEVYARFATEIPSTSLPTGSDINDVFTRIKADGYEKVLVFCLSSGLSGTYNAMRIQADAFKELEIVVIDTKNIAIAAGLNAIAAAEYLKEGMDWNTLVKTSTDNIGNSKIFFCVSTLEYLQKGGRIGLVSSLIGTTLSLKPIISCNNEGIYYTAAKVIGRKRSINKIIELALEFAQGEEKYNVSVVHGGVPDEANKVKETIMPLLPNCNIFTEGAVSPVIGVHAGPGTLGIAIQKL